VGAEYLWVKDRKVNDALSRGAEYFIPKVKSDMLGTLWAFDYKKVKALNRKGDGLEISHWSPEEVITRRDGLIASAWEVDMARAGAGGCRRVTLPIFNLKYFGVRDDKGNTLATGQDEYGRIVLHDRNLLHAKKIFIEYPRPGLRYIIIVSNIIYGSGLIGLLVLFGVSLCGVRNLLAIMH